MFSLLKLAQPGNNGLNLTAFALTARLQNGYRPAILRDGNIFAAGCAFQQFGQAILGFMCVYNHFHYSHSKQ